MAHIYQCAVLAATISAPAVTTPAASAQITRRPQANGPDVITISGIIEQADDKKFADLTLGLNDAIVVVNSRGGYNSAATNIGFRIRSHNYETRVHSGAICNSACTLIWLAGTYRHLDPKTRLGFHSAREKRDTSARFEEGNRTIAEYLTKLGTPQQVIDLQPKADPCCFNYVGYAQAKAWGLLSDRSAKQQQALPTPKTQEPGNQQAADLATADICRCVKDQLLPSDCKGTCVGSICLGYCKPERPIAEQSRKLLTPETQQPATTAPASPKIKTLVARPVTPSPEPVPQEPPPTAAIADRIEPGSQQAPAAQKVVLYEEDPADPNGKRFVGSAIWRTEMVTVVPGQPPQLVIRADIEVPERKLAMTFSFRRNTDKGLPATYTVEINFKLPADFPAGGISNVPGILMKQAETTRGVPLAGLAVKVTPGFYLVGLSNQEADKERNLQLLKERGWFNIPVVYNNNRRAILAMEKGTSGERAFADAFTAWKQ